MTMVASFMPSMAFAANTNSGHTFYKYNEHYTVVNGEAKAIADQATQDQIDKYVEVVSAPTCTKAGSVVLKCNTPLPEEVACDETITETIPADHSWTTKNVNMTIDEYAAQLVAQKSKTEAEAKAWVKAQKGKCHVSAKRCKNCGEVKPIGEGSEVVEHDYTGADTCASKVQCSYAGCTVMINTPVAKKTLPHTLGDETNKTEACGGVVTSGRVCSRCGEFVPNGEVGDKGNTPKCNAFVGDIPAGSVTKSIDGKKVFYNGKKIADIESDGVKCEDGYHYDANRDVFVKADTVKDGKYAYTCSKCGYVQTFENVDVPVACSHAWVKETTDATCGAPAMEYMVCTECNAYKKVNDPDTTVQPNKTDASTAVTGSKALGHALEVKEIAGDCHDTARYEIKCTRCHDNLNVTAANFKTLPEGTSLYVNPAATNLTEGAVSTVNVVGSVELKYLSATTTDDHKFTKKVTVKAATCENNEIVAYVCDTCGKLNVHTSTIVPGTKLAHEIEKVDTPATCKMTAGSVEKCKNCDYEKVLVKAEPIKGGEHSGEAWKVTKKATVFEEGVKTLVCAACGEELGAKTPVAIAKYAAPAVKAGKKSATVTVKATADAVSYKISYKKAGGSYKTIAAKAGKKTIKKLAKGKKYTFKAIAVNAEGVEVASATKTVKVK